MIRSLLQYVIDHMLILLAPLGLAYPDGKGDKIGAATGIGHNH
jgi:hypothetical protein